MSAIAEFKKIKVNKLEELKEVSKIIIKKGLFSKKVIDNYWSFLNENSESIIVFDINGYVYGNLMVFLEENEIDLFNNEFKEISNYLSEQRNSSVFIFTYKQSNEILKKINQTEFSIDDLVNFNIEFSDENEPELAKTQIEALNTLKMSLQKLKNSEEVIILNIA